MFDDYVSLQETLNRGLDQGFPGIALLFNYNADLLDITQASKGEYSVAVADDVTIVASGTDLREATRSTNVNLT